MTRKHWFLLAAAFGALDALAWWRLIHNAGANTPENWLVFYSTIVFGAASLGSFMTACDWET